MSRPPVSFSDLVARGWRAAAAALTALAAVASVTSAWVEGPPARMLGAVPGSAGASGVLSVATGAGLLVLARGLWRGRRRAALAAAALLAAAATVRLAAGAALAPTAAELVVASAIIATARVFGCRGQPRAGRAAGALAAVAAACAYGVAVAAVLATDSVRGLRAALEPAAGWLLTGGWWLRSGRPEALVLDALLGIVLVAGGWLVRELLRPVPAYDGHTAAEHARAGALVAEHRVDSLDAFALREDKSFHFGAGGVLAYRVVRGMAIVAGDPIGPPGSAPAVLASFQRVAAERGWEVAVTAASARHLDGYHALGYRSLAIGEEAVVDPRVFSLEGRAVRKVRQSVARVNRLGWTVAIVDAAALEPAVVREIAAVERAWRGGRPRLQGFAMTLGRLWGAGEDADALYVLARDPGGALGAFLRFEPYAGGLSLDVMRRLGDEPNGLNEALVVAALSHARAHGLREVSLNFAGFAHVMGRDPRELTGGQRALRWILARAHGRFQLERLVRFNAKFSPTWRPRYLVYRGPMTLPRVGLRVLQAEAYIRAPRPRPLPAAWRPSTEPVGRPARSGALLPAASR